MARGRRTIQKLVVSRNLTRTATNPFFAGPLSQPVESLSGPEITTDQTVQDSFTPPCLDSKTQDQEASRLQKDSLSSSPEKGTHVDCVHKETTVVYSEDTCQPSDIHGHEAFQEQGDHQKEQHPNSVIGRVSRHIDAVGHTIDAAVSLTEIDPIISSFDLEPDSNKDLDCDEGIEPELPERDAFLDLDEIEDWDVSLLEEENAGRPVDSVLENTCPLCGISLESLRDVTPDAHLHPLNSFKSTSSYIDKCDFELYGINCHPQSYQRMATSNKDSTTMSILQKDARFTVDAFSYGAIDGCKAYFLSHFHSDHYGGLTRNWGHGPIYCSSITANLVLSRLGVDQNYVKRLPMYEPTVVEGVTVRLMDANHCPGSVLFVFDLENPQRRYLHTGDFRATPDMIVHPILKQPENVPIDILYLDTTYSNPKYTFPPQDLVIEETAQLICKEVGIKPLATAPVVVTVEVKKKETNVMERWLRKESGNSEKLVAMSIKTSQTLKAKQKWQEPTERNKIVICVGTYLIGKERVFMAIAKAIKSKVYVQHSKYQILACLEDKELMDMLTHDPREAQVHLLHMGSEMSPEALHEYLDKLGPTFTRLIAIRPTGWTFTGSKKHGPGDSASPDTISSAISTPTPPPPLVLKPTYTSASVKIYPVPYSEHSSFSELAGFCRSLNISRIIPTVGVGSEKGRHMMEVWFKRWEQERQQGVRWLLH
ncbi:DNA break repair nuclease [Lunasporangiospora selenospora]|uniref:DNA break repair nuclease n=1 Tax=Lunasporangiospora selenospora TaxID=979761 RepID=A0A9P6KDJ9_9FUNG|nr:DNA break repair nuclease [Lunasporangiospora selenospora]